MPRKREDVAGRIRQKVVAGLHLGVVAHGQRLASVRELALEMSVDPRVALAAYRQLEVEGLVEIRPRSGVYVAGSAEARSPTLPRFASWTTDVFVEALVRGLAPAELPDRIRRCLETVRLRAACIECNHDQIAGLCRELSRDYGLVTEGVEVEELSGATLPPALEGADLLVTTPFHSIAVQRVAERLGKPWISVHLRPDFLAEVSRFLQEGEVYFVATDPRFGEKLKIIFSSTGRVENLRPLIVGRDDPARIPSAAPTYVMPSARPLMEAGTHAFRFIASPRVFSEESARELLSFIVRANLDAEGGSSGASGRSDRVPRAPVSRPPL